MRAWLGLLLLMFMAPFAAGQCSSGTFSNINLGTYTGVLSTSGVTTDTVTCNYGAILYLGFDQRTASGATVTARSMTGPNFARLSYALYQDASRTLNWGNTRGTDAYVFTGTGSSQNINIYPSVAAGQLVTPGTDTDTITLQFGNSLGTYTQTFTVTATVLSTCTVAATALAFGNYIGSQKDVSSSVTVSCSNTTPYYVNLGDGLNYDGGFYPRMNGPAGTLISYRLYQDATRSIDWRNTVNYDGQTGTGTGVAQPLTVYGRMFANQYGPPGAYSDTETVKVTY